MVFIEGINLNAAKPKVIIVIIKFVSIRFILEKINKPIKMKTINNSNIYLGKLSSIRLIKILLLLDKTNLLNLFIKISKLSLI